MPFPIIRRKAAIAAGPPPPPPPPPPPAGPEWDFFTDSPAIITGPGTASIHWGIIVFSHVGAVTYSDGASGTIDVDLANGQTASGIAFSTVGDDTGSSAGAFFWQAISIPV